MIDKSMKKKRSAHFFSHTIKVGFAVLLLTCGVLGFCAAPAAAGPSVGNYLFYYENITGSTGTYMSQSNVLVLDGINVLDQVNLYPEGTYVKTMPTQDYDAFVLKKLDANVVMKVYDEDDKVIYNGIDEVVLRGSRVSFEVVLNMPTIKYHQSTKDSSLPYVGLRFINPSGDIFSSRLGSVDYGADSTIRWDINKLDDNLDVGTWTVQAFFVPKNEPGFFAPYTPDDDLYGSLYSFTVVTPSAKRLISLADEIIEGSYATIELESSPGVDTISVENGILPAGQLNVDYSQSANGIYKITVPPSGVSTFAVQSTNSNDLKVSLLNKNGEVETSTTIHVRPSIITLNTVNLKIAAPMAGATPATSVSGTNIVSESVTWNPSVSSTFAADTQYKATIKVKSAAGYEFSSTPTVTVNGNSVAASKVSVSSSKDRLTITDYVVGSTGGEISSVSLAVDAPVLGEKPDATVTKENSANYDVSSIAWYKTSVNSGNEIDFSDIFEPSTVYIAEIKLIAKDGYLFKSSTSKECVKVNNREVDSAIISIDKKGLNLQYKFPATGEYLTSFTLHSGWNFISVPKKLSADYNTAAELFAGVNTNNNAILSYNAKTQIWEQVKADTEIVPLNAYYIYSVNEKVITPTFDTGAHVPASKAVYKGWNAVGISAEKPMTAADAFNNINWRTYLIWNPTIQKYDTTIIKGNKAASSEDTFINLWKGGWLFMDEDNTIIGYA